MSIFIGVDNGASGSVGIINADIDMVWYYHTPIKKELSYTKKKQWINRINGIALEEMLSSYTGVATKVFIERPLVTPRLFTATMSAVRALEATLIIVEGLKLSYQYIDSRTWQKGLLPSGIEGSSELKKASLQIGKRIFPQVDFNGFTDADGLLIAEWARRMK